MPSETASTPEPERRVLRDRRKREREATHVVLVSVTGVVAIFLLLALAVIGLVRFGDQTDRIEAAVVRLDQQQRAINELRQDQQLAVCLQGNDQTMRQRRAFVNSVGIVRRPGPPDPQVEEFIANYTRIVEATLPFRDCSAKGIRTYYANPPAPVPCAPDGKGFCE